MAKTLSSWQPDNETFWQREGRQVARRNLWISVPALFLAFAIWMVWSVVVVSLPEVGFDFSTDQLFWLAALPGLSGATLRIFYSFMVPIFGGRRWTAISTFSLLIPAIGMGFAVQDPSTPYSTFLLLAILSGLGGGNFASSMANITYFFPKKEKGEALALNAGLGNLGVSAVQFVVPLIITVGAFSFVVGGPQYVDGQPVWLQNAAFFWVPFIMLSGLTAWFGMNDIASMKASFKSQATIFKRKHNWLMCFLYVGTFGSFIGFSAAFPLLAKSQFPAVDSLQLAFLGPLVGALSRAFSGKMCDKYGGGIITFWVFVVMLLGTLGLIYFLSVKDAPYAFYGFFATFMVLFVATGVGNASTFQMIPTIFRKDRERHIKDQGNEAVRRAAEIESAATIGFSSAMGAYGAFFIPKAYGASIGMTGEAFAALVGFTMFYAACLGVVWFYYVRKKAEIRC